jgi:hypothetical protein
VPHQTETKLYTLFGIVVWGDLGPTTIYRTKQGKMVFFAKTWPRKPPSPKQAAQRDRFRQAAQAWNTLTPATQTQWNRATLEASLCMTGYDLFVYWFLTGDTATIRTIQHHTNTQLLPP